MKNVHNLKVLPTHFADVRARVKLAEFRFNDRDFRVGDFIILREWVNPLDTRDLTGIPEFAPERGFTGEVEYRVVTHVLTHEAFAPLPKNWVVLSIREVGDEETSNIQSIVSDERVIFAGRVPPERVLQGAIDAGLDSVVVAGWVPEPGVEGPGELYIAASHRDDKTVYLLRRAEHAVLSGDL